MKTIVFCNSTLAWGGGENWHLEAALFMAEQGYNVILMAHEQGELYAKARTCQHARLSVQPFSIGRLSFLNPFCIARHARFLRANRVDTVIMNLPQDLKCMGLAAQKARVPQVIYRRGSALPVRDSWINRYLYGSVLTGLIVNSQATKSELYRHNPRLIPENRVIVLPNGIDVAAFDTLLAASGPLPGFETALSRASEPLGVAGRPVVLGNAGRLNKQKGQHYLLYLGRALEALGVEYRLVIAGSGERKDELSRLAESLGISSKVAFTGFLHDTSPFWKSIDVFVLTSLWEGFGYVLLEAMLCAKPVLAFGVSNIPELIQDGYNGFLFPLPGGIESARKNNQISGVQKEADADTYHKANSDMPRRADSCLGGSGAVMLPEIMDMAQAVKRLAHDPALRQSMGENGRRFADPAFDQAKVMQQLLQYIEA